MAFKSELDFERNLITFLFDKGWEHEVLKNKTEEELIQNWADILYQNNRGIDELGNYPLTEGEMWQIISQVNQLKTPLRLNGFINGKSVSIVRDNPNDKAHLGKTVSLKIYDRLQIAAGSSRYQIAEQPKFKTSNPLTSDRRGDFMLLINGMPVIHVELKKSGVPIIQAANQIKKYAAEGIFSKGIFSLIQVFVAMNPEDAWYFANPGDADNFRPEFYFHWADFNNQPILDWKGIATHLLSIPMAHQLVGNYTVADDTDGVLKVMRSYQYYAASAISDRVARCQWNDRDIYGGYIWHTTGSGKTMTSFKSAQLIATSKDADKVVFLMDRIELGTQSAMQYRGFAGEDEEVQETSNTTNLLLKLKSDAPEDTLIVTSIQKMSKIVPCDGNAHDLALINAKRVVIIIDEAHRSTFGDMLIQIRATFKRAIFFGFTGTPIEDENHRGLDTTTRSIFGNELHRYSIADGIRDKNVLGFDPVKVITFRDHDVRKVVALEKAHAASEEEAIADEKKAEIYYKYMDATQVPMVGSRDELGNYTYGIEDYLSNAQYETQKYRRAVVKDILEKFPMLSRNRKFHAIFATSCIKDAFEYYVLLRTECALQNLDLRITCQVDPSIDNGGAGEMKEELLTKIVGDYNEMFDMHFTLPKFAAFKRDIASRLAHVGNYKGIEKQQGKTIDLLIVVDQMLTGYDSKWVNTLYMDKTLQYQHLIQALSRTNRIFGPEKPFGNIRYYRKPHTMERDIAAAIRLYSGDKPFGIFANHLEANLRNMDNRFLDIKDVFESAGIADFVQLPEEQAAKAKFAKLFRELNGFLEASRLQEFRWDKRVYDFPHEDGTHTTYEVALDEQTYMILLLRYRELATTKGPGGDDVPYDIDPYLTEINTGAIDTNYMNSRFQKYVRALLNYSSEEELAQALDELHRTFATLTAEEQKYAELFLHDVQQGKATVEEDKSLRDYITEYIANAHNDRTHRFAEAFGMDENLLRDIMTTTQDGGNINEFGKFDQLVDTVNREQSRATLERMEGAPVQNFRVAAKIDNILRRFINEGGFEI